MNDLISRQEAIAKAQEIIGYESGNKAWAILDALRQLPSAHTTINGYDIKHLALIAAILQKESLSPERVTEALTDINRIVTIVVEEFEETLRKAVDQI